MNAHSGLNEAQCRRLDAALVLLLANHVADPSTLRACIDAARTAVTTKEKV